jgi:riboflavin biosynthesis pyrimidine reductase
MRHDGCMNGTGGGTVDLRTGVGDRADLLDLYAVPAGRWVRANFVSTLDGRATGPDGRSGTINSPADEVVFDALRAMSDVVVVASGTLRAEGYTRLSTPEPWRGHRATLGRPVHPPLVAVTASGDLPERLLHAGTDTGDLLVALTQRTPPRTVSALRERLGEPAVLVCGADQVDPRQLLDELADRGLQQVLTEGGPRLLGSWVDADVVDEICLTLRPLLVGGEGTSILAGAEERLREARLVAGLSFQGDLMLRYHLH